jgi:hypothetical protein
VLPLSYRSPTRLDKGASGILTDSLPGRSLVNNVRKISPSVELLRADSIKISTPKAVENEN